MRTLRISLCLAALFAAGPLTSATAQQTSGSRNVNQRERMARASWQPTRPRSARERVDADAAPVNPVRENSVRQVDHNVPIDGVPSFPAGSVSVIDPPIHASQLHPAPLDGQIVAPHYDGSCDSLPTGTCGCGDTGCDGGCDSCDGGCDSLGCDGACGGEGCSCCGELCSPEAWRPCVTICLPQDGWASFEYLSWWQDGMRLPPLVTTSLGDDVAQVDAGVLGRGTTRTLFGGGNVLTDQFDGGRIRFGLWLDRCHTWGVGAEIFQIGSESDGFNGTSTGDPILARPFTNTQNNSLQDAELVAFPGVVSGTVNARVTSELRGASVNFRYLRCCDEGCSQGLFCGCPGHYCSRSEALFGWRYLQLDESVTVSEDLVGTQGGTFDIDDRFVTKNVFNGVDLGMSQRVTRGFWTVDGLIRLGVGNTRQTIRRNGTTTINSDQNDPPVQEFNEGILVGSSNRGSNSYNEFSVVPEFNANVGYQVTDHIRLTFGYTFIYWSNVARPGDQIDLSLNPELFPPPADPITGAQLPEFNRVTTDYWVQGINTGFEYRW